jgi:cellulose synthase/poly-beta-1,6-N-acetylglucosamine synthase-like glycosyltransferase
VIIPTVEPKNKDFKECLVSIWENGPREIFIVVVGEPMKTQTRSIVDQLPLKCPKCNIRTESTDCTGHTKITVLSTDEANKRSQIVHALRHVRTKIVALSDDHVFWRSPRFLPTVLAPFEDPKVGGVCTNKRVRRDYQLPWAQSIWNMLGALYLERHNFEIRASYTVDTGIFVASGRTAIYRTEILKIKEFLRGFTNEYLLGTSKPVSSGNENFITRFWYCLLAWFGTVSTGDDNYITRYLVRNEWKIVVQYCDDALIETTLGIFPKFIWQCVRWSRTTWNSNVASLFTDRTVWRRQPWCVYAVYLTSFVNFALFYDPALVFTFSKTTWRHQWGLPPIFVCIILSKLVKLTPYFLRHPRDLIFLPTYFVFVYSVHSPIKLFALLTVWDTSWWGRNLKKQE